MTCAPSEDSDQPADAQADLSLRWTYMPLCWFCHAAVQMTTAASEDQAQTVRPHSMIWVFVRRSLGSQGSKAFVIWTVKTLT